MYVIRSKNENEEVKNPIDNDEVKNQWTMKKQQWNIASPRWNIDIVDSICNHIVQSQTMNKF